MRRLLATTGVLVAVAGFAVGCGGGKSAPASAPPASTPAPVSSASTQAQPSLSAEQVADPLLPSRLTAKLDRRSVHRLAQFFEDKVSHAYADGKPDELYHYLAGPMLNGNRATINLLSGQHKRNVYKIKVGAVSLQTDQPHHVVFTMNADMTVNYFFNPRTHKILDHGLPGPSQVKFVMFFDQNPKTKTWYWTGEENNANGAGNGVTTGSNGTVETQ